MNLEMDALSSWSYRLGMVTYRAAVSTFFTMGGLSLLRRKYGAGLEERMGNFSPAISKNILWVHSVSVGEVQSAIPLIDAAREHSKIPCILSTVTQTGRAMAEKLVSQKVNAIIYSPWDSRRFVKQALDTLKPRAYVAMETERWPNMLHELHARAVPTFLANGRLSEASAEKLRRQRRFWLGVLNCFDCLMVRFESDAERFSSLGVSEKKIMVTGDCKIDAMLTRKSEFDPSKWQYLRNGNSPLFLAGSTHEGEEEIVLNAFAQIRHIHPRARLIIVPRHPERASFVAASALKFGKVVLLTHFIAKPFLEWSVAVVDTIGVLFELYAAADAAFVGGSLVPKGGQNLMESALFGIQTTHGPDMSDFPDTVRMDALGASYPVQNSDDLAKNWLLSLDQRERARTRQNCEEYFKSTSGAALRSWQNIEKFLDRREQI